MSWAWPWEGVLRELVEVRLNEAQLPQYVAVIEGIRRSLDDWIPATRLHDFLRLMKRHGLAVEIDCVFKHLEAPSKVPGAERVPTTQALGALYPSGLDDSPGTSVHVIISTRADWAAETLAAAWYPVVVGGRLIGKPQVEHYRLGLGFGYPRCCVDFFMSHNDWPRLNTLAEAARVSSSLRWEANCLPKHSPWMTVFHMPCSFDCPATLAYTANLLKALRRLDRGYARRIEETLRQPYLVISEVLCYALEGASSAGGSRVAYRRARYVGGHERHDRYSALLAAGDELSVSDGIVFVRRGGRLVANLETNCHAGVAEVPMLLEFK